MWRKLVWVEGGIVVDDGDGDKGGMVEKKGVKWRDDRKYNNRRRVWV